MEWADLKECINETLNLPDPDFLDVVASTILAIKLPMDPVWIMVAGPSGSSKTEVLRLFTGGFVHHATSATAAALVSGMLVKDKDGKEFDNSFLRRLDGKTWIIKDYSEILTMPQDARMKFEGTMRDAHDGYVVKEYGGSVQERGFKTRFNVIAATTGTFEVARDEQGKSWGERYIIFRPSAWNRRELANHVLEQSTTIRGERRELQRYIKTWIKDFEFPETIDYMPEGLISIADFVTAARSPVIRNRYRQDSVECIPELEMPSRFAKQLYTIAKSAHYIGADPQRIVKRIARGSIPIVRYKLLEQFLGREFLRLTDIEDTIKVSARVLRFRLNDLALLGILHQSRTGSTGTPYSYTLNPEWGEGFRMVFDNRWMGGADDEEEEEEEPGDEEEW